jgi:SAM-dependent methyltransferase
MEMQKPVWAKGYRAENEYTFGLYPAMNPHNLVSYSLLQGVKPDICSPNLDADGNAQSIVYCELGSGQGVTLNFMAARDPAGSYYGVDYNPNHIRNSRSFAKLAGLDNVHFIEKSFADLDTVEIPDCDVIVLHGIWSWIAPEMREAIVRFIDRKMKPGGLLYLSYNCAVGRTSDEPMRKLFLALERSSQHSELNSRMSDIFRVASDISEKGAAYFTNHPATVRRLKGLAGQDPNYMEQEYLSETWTNFFFDDVALDLNKAKMQFVCSTHMERNITEYVIPANALSFLDRFSSVADLELFKDIYQDTLFRQDVFAKGQQRLGKDDVRLEIGEYHFALARRRSDCPLQVRVGSGTARIPAVPYDSILDMMINGPVLGKDIFSCVDGMKTSIDGVAALKSLIAFGYVTVVPDAASINRSRLRMQAFEDAYERVVASKFNRFIGVIPGLATTVSLSMLDYYFWQSYRHEIDEKSVWVLDQLHETRRHVTIEGQVVRSHLRAIELLQEHETKFEEMSRPLMKLGYLMS